MADVHSAVREIEALEMKLRTAVHTDEQQALEEDVTGRILWFYWRGICSELDQLLTKVQDAIRNDLHHNLPGWPLDPLSGFCEIARITKGTRRIGVRNHTTHLPRIMRDAGAGISKHELWLAARCQSRLILGDNPVPDIQETASDTSSLDTEMEYSISSRSPLNTEAEGF